MSEYAVGRTAKYPTIAGIPISYTIGGHLAGEKDSPEPEASIRCEGPALAILMTDPRTKALIVWKDVELDDAAPRPTQP